MRGACPLLTSVVLQPLPKHACSLSRLHHPLFDSANLCMQPPALSTMMQKPPTREVFPAMSRFDQSLAWKSDDTHLLSCTPCTGVYPTLADKRYDSPSAGGEWLLSKISREFKTGWPSQEEFVKINLCPAIQLYVLSTSHNFASNMHYGTQ